MRHFVRENTAVLAQMLEQLVASAGTFLFMVVGARMLGLEEFGLIALLWNLIQMPTTLFFSLVLLPISSSRDSAITPAEVLSHALTMFSLLCIGSMIFYPLSLRFVGGIYGNSSTKVLLLLVTWGALQTAYELMRWLIIRYGDYKVSLCASLLRWIAFFLGVWTINRFGFCVDLQYYLSLNMSLLILWLLIGTYSLQKVFDFSAVKLHVSAVQIRSSIPVLVYSIGNVTVNYLLMVLIVRLFSLEFLGAYQAYKSFANIFGTLSQYIDNHFTAYLVRNNKTLNITMQTLGAIFFASLCGLVFGYGIKDLIAMYLLDSRFLPYSSLFALLFYGAFSQLLTRPIMTQIRITDNTGLFYLALLIMVIVLCPLIIIFGIGGYAYWVIFFSESMPFVLFVAYIIRTKYPVVKDFV